MRTQARESVLKILYARTINPLQEDSLKRGLFKNLEESAFDFASQLLELIDGHEEKILSVIDDNITNFKEDRLYPVDRIILMIAVAEILYIDEIPAAVSASEASDLAEKYSTERSANLVGGVLSGVIKKCVK